MTISSPTRASVAAVLLLVGLALAPWLVAQPAATDAPPKTGAFDATFTERSPQSAPKELARRLRLQDKDVAGDYDLSKMPFKVYVPKNYDPATPHGLFVYLGYKDSVSTPETWWPALDEAHLIFVTPVAHTGENYPNVIPLWQSVGLALDAVRNLKQQYKVDANRVDLMIWRNGMTVALATADEFTGFVIIDPPFSWKKVILPANHYMPPGIPAPLPPLLTAAQGRGFYFGGLAQDSAKVMTDKVLPQEGFRHVMLNQLSTTDDLHYPNFKPDWFTKSALPFLDEAAAAEAKRNPPAAAPKPRPTAATASTPTTAAAVAAKPAVSKAQQLLNMAQLYANNGQRDLAKTKLQQLLADYPNDPAAPKAKQLLEQLSSP